ERVINVSNAPPVQLKRRRGSDDQWEIGQGSGGLVSCCDPFMGKDTENVWLACFGPDVPFPGSGSEVNSSTPKLTNSLGIPIIHPAITEVKMSMLLEQEEGDEVIEEVREEMSLLGVLRNYNKDNYKLNPVIVNESDYNTYYGGISNGLLWPALHTLTEYIVKDYDDSNVLRDHWNAYVRVNYQFALNAVRKSRPQDFLWIHDYHLILTGMVVHSLDADIEVGFFLHIPFQPPPEFFTKYLVVAEAVVRGIMRFTKVGFQTHLDRQTFVDIVRERFPVARIQYNEKTDKHVVSYDGFTSTLGVFPVSIKNEDFLAIAETPSIQNNAKSIRQRVMKHSKPDGRFFFSVERSRDVTNIIKEAIGSYTADYRWPLDRPELTQACNRKTIRVAPVETHCNNIQEKIKAFMEYYRLFPDRLGKDVFVQVAVTNRRTVETYRVYQDDCLAAFKLLNETCRCADQPDWRPCIFLTDGLTRPNLVAHYLAMDVGVVTPRKDGMNLVAKEMIVCNPKASLLISCGAGTEQQFNSAGFYTDAPDGHCYHRVTDIYDSINFAKVLYEAAVQESSNAEVHGRRLKDFMLVNSIEKWSDNFLDPSWTPDVVQVTTLKTMKDFNLLFAQLTNVRRKIVQRVLNGQSLRPHFAISLRNVHQSLEQSLDPQTRLLTLAASDAVGAKISAVYDVQDELRQLNIDLDFLKYVQSEAYDNLEQFLQDLSKYHPSGVDEFAKELENVLTLISKGDYFDYFFSDRDGTLRSYTCTYASSVQGAYSGVIQATFAHRCTQYAAIVTSAPLRNIGILDVLVVPDGYYCYGASGGREWYVRANKRFKDTSISDADLQMLELLADRIALLLEKPEFRQFAWIGSGLQRHYGHVTVTRQDVYNSIDQDLSDKLFMNVFQLVNEIDPSGRCLHVSDTETDIKIHLKAKLSGKTFTKGHGIRLFAEKMKLDLSRGNILVCGDSETDLPMLKEVS
uniref:Trehalose-6-phosphate phosphatase helical bundle domain-containing protein n=1 Tax=Romanomermis culicivorax TaxID=13658 RepID=A0A915J2R3_ROMCU